MLDFLRRKSVKKELIKPTDTTFPKTFIPLQNFWNSNYTDAIQQMYENNLLIYLFNHVAEVNSIITYIAQIGSDVPIKHIYKQANGKEKEIKNSIYTKLLETPNEFTSGKLFLFNIITQYFTTGNVYLNKLKPIGLDYFTKLYLLSANNVFPFIEGALEPYGEIIQDIDYRMSKLLKYNWKLNNRFIPLDPDSVIHIKDSSIGTDARSMLTGKSRLYAATENIRALSYMVETINTLLANKGMIGFISKTTRANIIDSRMDPAEKKDAELNINNYGTTGNRRPIMVSDYDLKWNPINNPLSEFMPIELQEHDFKLLCKVLGGFPEVLLSSSDTTFTNLPMAQKLLYQNIIIPLLNNIYQSISQGLNLPENEKIIPNFDNIECLMEDDKLLAQSRQIEDDLWINRYKNNLCTLNELLTAIELPNQTNGDKYYGNNQTNDQNNLNAQNTNLNNTQNANT